MIGGSPVLTYPQGYPAQPGYSLATAPAYTPPRLTPVKKPIVRAQAPDEKPRVASAGVKIPTPEALGVSLRAAGGEPAADSLRVPTPEELGVRVGSAQ